MSKCNINNHKKTKSVNTVKDKLSEVGLTMEDVRKWLETGDLEEENEEYPEDQALFSFLGIERKPKKITTCEDLVEENARDFFKYLNSVDGDGEFDSSDEQSVKQSCTGKVTFVPGKTADDTEVYVDDIQIGGVARAVLEYDAESNIPKLTLEIMNPVVN
jgi:hypothetical protein